MKGLKRLLCRDEVTIGRSARTFVETQSEDEEHLDQTNPETRFTKLSISPMQYDNRKSNHMAQRTSAIPRFNFSEGSHLRHSVALPMPISPGSYLVTPTRSPQAESCLCKTRRQAACKAPDTQKESNELGKWWYHGREKILL
jgi:hypothetical protein